MLATYEASTLHFMKSKMAAVAFLGLIARGRFSHGGVSGCAAMLGMSFDAVPFDHENDPARILDAGEELDRV